MSRSTLRPDRLLTLSLGGACALLALLLIGQRWLAGNGSDADAIRVSQVGDVTVSSLETRQFELPPKSEYAEVTARPLFNEDRRPIETESMEQPDENAVAEKEPTELPPVSLTGVIITPEQRIAMMRNTENREYVTLKEGDPLEGWTLEEVERRRIVFTTGGKRQVVELEVHTGNLSGGGGRARGGRRQQGAANGDRAQQGEQKTPASATQQIRERIQRERERRRELIEQARKRQQDADSDQ